MQWGIWPNQDHNFNIARPVIWRSACTSRGRLMLLKKCQNACIKRRDSAYYMYMAVLDILCYASAIRQVAPLSALANGLQS